MKIIVGTKKEVVIDNNLITAIECGDDTIYGIVFQADSITRITLHSLFELVKSVLTEPFELDDFSSDLRLYYVGD